MDPPPLPSLNDHARTKSRPKQDDCWSPSTRMAMDEPRRRLGPKYWPKVVAADATCSPLVRCLLRSDCESHLKRFFGDVINPPSGIRYAGPVDRSSGEFESHPGNYGVRHKMECRGLMTVGRLPSESALASPGGNRYRGCAGVFDSYHQIPGKNPTLA